MNGDGLALFVGGLFVPGRVPPGARRHEEVGAGVLVGVFESQLDLFSARAFFQALLSNLRLPLIEQVARALQEQHAEHVLLVLAGIHVAAQVIASGEEQAFKPGKGKSCAGHRFRYSCLLISEPSTQHY